MVSASKLTRELNKISDSDMMTVGKVAGILGVSKRRVRAFIKPECNCIIRQRRKGVANPKAPKKCMLGCGGTGYITPRLPARKNEDGNYRISGLDLREFAKRRRKTGRPTIKTHS